MDHPYVGCCAKESGFRVICDCPCKVVALKLLRIDVVLYGSFTPMPADPMFGRTSYFTIDAFLLPRRKQNYLKTSLRPVSPPNRLR